MDLVYTRKLEELPGPARSTHRWSHGRGHLNRSCEEAETELGMNHYETHTYPVGLFFVLAA